MAAVRDPRRSASCSRSRRGSARARRRPVAIAAVVLGLATIGWNLTGEISAANQAVAPGEVPALAAADAARLDRPADGPRAHDVLRQGPSNSYAFWSLEFWNQSIQDVWSVDASAPPPGPDDDRRTSSAPTARSTRSCPLDWVVAPPGLVIAGRVGRAGRRADPLPRAAPDPDGELRLGDHARRLDAAGQPVRPLRAEAGPRDGRRSRLDRAAACVDRPGALHLPRLEPADRRRRPAGARAGCSASSRRSRRRAS